jgi:hypothetical protein
MAEDDPKYLKHLNQLGILATFDEMLAGLTTQADFSLHNRQMVSLLIDRLRIRIQRDLPARGANVCLCGEKLHWIALDDKVELTFCLHCQRKYRRIVPS